MSFPRNLLPGSLALCLLLPLSGCKKGEPAPAPKPTAKEPGGLPQEQFTEWLPRHLFNRFLMERDQAGPDGKNYWSSGRCIEKIEGRWADGYQQYRIVIGDIPQGEGFQWTWYFDMEREVFQKRLTKLSMAGYRMVSVAHNTTPSGSDSFAAVWHKTSEAPSETRPPGEKASGEQTP